MTYWPHITNCHNPRQVEISISERFCCFRHCKKGEAHVKINVVFFASSNEVGEAVTGRSAGWVRALAATALAVAIGVTAAANAMAIVPNCSVITPLSEPCGWVISAPGCY